VSNLYWLLLGRVEDPRIERLAGHPDLSGRVRLLGWRDDGPRLMEAMDIFAMPSRSEGFSRSVMEAMELGLCPVATRVGGTPEMVRDNVDGLVVAPNDAAALAAAIRRLSGDATLRRSLAESSRQRIKSTFTVEQMVEGTVDMYRTVSRVADQNLAGSAAA
jgi:glycosyltransferase involved in cell wall biosynthesis